MLGLSHSFDIILKCRSFAILGQFAVVLMAWFWLQISFSMPIVLGVLGVSVFVTILSFWFNRHRAVTPRHIFIQLAYDVLSFTVLLYFTGGIQNPFTGLYLIQVIIAAVMLSRIYTWSIVLLSCSAYISLTLTSSHAHHQGHNPLLHWHMEGMILSYMISAFLVAGFIGRIVKSHREQRDALLRLEQQVKEDTMLGQVGLLATNAAHELSSPLSTIGMIADELEDSKSDIELTALLKKQVLRSKHLLQDILLSFGTVRAEEIRRLSIPKYVALLETQCEQRHPRHHVSVTTQTQEPSEWIIPGVLDRAVHNLIDNAVHVCPEESRCIVDLKDEYIVIKISDKGPGIPQQILDKLGQFGSDLSLEKKGLGLYLSHTIIKKLGGEMVFDTQKGTTITLRIPLEKGVRP